MRTKMRSPQTQFRNILLNVGIRLITSLESNRMWETQHLCQRKNKNNSLFAQYYFMNDARRPSTAQHPIFQFIYKRYFFQQKNSYWRNLFRRTGGFACIWALYEKQFEKSRFVIDIRCMDYRKNLNKEKKLTPKTHSLRMQSCMSKVVRRLIPVLLVQSTGELSMYELFLSISLLPTFEFLSDRPLGWALSLFAFV